MIKKKSKLTNREKRYCRCLIKVRTKGIQNPYAICTNSVYNLQKKKRKTIVKCTKNYDFTKMTLKQLQSYSRKKKIKYSGYRKKELIQQFQKN
jgi:hypothetical protein